MIKQFGIWLGNQPSSFYIGWFLLCLLMLNHYLFPGRLLEHSSLHLLTTSIGRILVHLISLLLATKVVTFQLKSFRKQ